MFWKALINSLETQENTANISKDIEFIINRSYRTKKYNKKCKILLNGLDSRMLITEDRIDDSKNRSMKFI